MWTSEEEKIIHVHQWLHQDATSSLKIFRDIVHFLRAVVAGM